MPYVLAVLAGIFTTMPPSDDWKIRGHFPSADECKAAWDALSPWDRESAKCMTLEEYAEALKPHQSIATPFLTPR